MRKLIIGVIWFIVIWFGVIFIAGGIVGFMAGAKTANSEMGAIAGRAAARAFMARSSGIIFIGSVLIAIVGTVAGVLPGTKTKRRGEKIKK